MLIPHSQTQHDELGLDVWFGHCHAAHFARYARATLRVKS